MANSDWSWMVGEFVYHWFRSLQWRHNDHDGISNHQPHVCLLNHLFRRRSKKTSKLRVTGLCVGNSPGPVNSRTKGQLRGKCFHLMTSSCNGSWPVCHQAIMWPKTELLSVELPGKNLCDILTHWGRDKMAAVSQTTLSNAFSWMKMFEFWLKFHWSLFLKVQLTIIQHWFR